MAPRSPDVPQLDFPQLVADVIAQLQLTGQVGLLNFADTVVPVYLIGQRDAITVAQAPAFTSAGVSSDLATIPAINTVLADIGPLAAGTYDVIAGFSTSNWNDQSNIEFQHRNAANAANLASWPNAVQDNPENAAFPLTFAYEIGLNERLRWQVLASAGTGAARVATYIMVQARTIP